jgi:hypothetical protein
MLGNRLACWGLGTANRLVCGRRAAWAVGRCLRAVSSVVPSCDHLWPGLSLTGAGGSSAACTCSAAMWHAVVHLLPLRLQQRRRPLQHWLWCVGSCGTCSAAGMYRNRWWAVHWPTACPCVSVCAPSGATGEESVLGEGLCSVPYGRPAQDSGTPHRHSYLEEACVQGHSCYVDDMSSRLAHAASRYAYASMVKSSAEDPAFVGEAPRHLY